MWRTVAQRSRLFCPCACYFASTINAVSLIRKQKESIKIESPSEIPPDVPPLQRPITAQEAGTVREHYKAICQQHPHSLILYQCGEFYEAYDDIQARHLAKLLNLSLAQTTRFGAFTGFPVKCLELHLPTLLSAKQRVVLVDQVSLSEVSPLQTKQNSIRPLIGRQVTRILTPGTLFEEYLMTETARNSFLLSLTVQDQQLGVAWLDVSTGHFETSLLPCDSVEMSRLFSRLQPKEILVQSELLEQEPVKRLLQNWYSVVQQLEPGGTASEWSRDSFLQLAQQSNVIPIIERTSLSPSQVALLWTQSFQSNNVWDQMQVKHSAVECHASAQIFHYLNQVSPLKKWFISPPAHLGVSVESTSPVASLPAWAMNVENTKTTMRLDDATFKALHLTQVQKQQMTLIDCLDETLTSAGARLLFSRLTAPSTHAESIEQRWSAVQYFLDHASLREVIRSHLRKCQDLARVLQRLNRVDISTTVHSVPMEDTSLSASEMSQPLLNSGAPKDLQMVMKTLTETQQTRALLINALALESNPVMQSLVLAMTDHSVLLKTLTSALLNVHDTSNVVQPGYHSALDALREKYLNCKQALDQFPEQLRQSHGLQYQIKILQPRHADCCLEVCLSDAKKLKSCHEFTLLSTATKSRFRHETLTRLSQMADDALNSMNRMEWTLIHQLVEFVQKEMSSLSVTADWMAAVDVACASAHLAKHRNHCRPKLVEQGMSLVLKGARHPFLEHCLIQRQQHYVKNDCLLTDSQRFMLITGCNMGGKTSYLRQVAIATVMAQAGLFVVADEAQFSLVDAVFTRLGAADDLQKDQSTFMMEMMETAHIVSHATERSLVLVDEMGRGTAADEGLAVAGAVAQYLLKSVQSRCLFATHYHRLASFLPSSVLFYQTLSRLNDKNELLLTHRMVPGVAQHSFGVHVARMAGVKEEVLKESERIYALLQAGKEIKQESAISPKVNEKESLSAKESLALDYVRQKVAQVDQLSPRDALQVLYDLHTFLSIRT